MEIIYAYFQTLLKKLMVPRTRQKSLLICMQGNIHRAVFNVISKKLKRRDNISDNIHKKM